MYVYSLPVAAFANQRVNDNIDAASMAKGRCKSDYVEMWRSNLQSLFSK